VPVFVALLRAVNVGGTGKLPMRELRDLCERTGFESVTTYIQSGNVVFRSSLTAPQVKRTLEAALGRTPNENELAEHMSMSVAEMEKMISDANAVGLISLNKKWYETDSYKDVREIDILEDKKGEDPTRRIQKNDLMRLVTKGLNRNERLIIILYYYEELTMKEIGATLDLSESRVSQMHSAIVQRLQGQLGRRRPEFGS